MRQSISQWPDFHNIHSAKNVRNTETTEILDKMVVFVGDASASERFCDLDLWPMTLKTFSALLTRVINISVKFHYNPSTKYGDIASREIDVNGRTDWRPENITLSAYTAVAEVRGEIIRTVPCCIVYWNCAQSLAHLDEQFLQFSGLHGFCHTGPISLCVDLFLLVCICLFIFHTA